MDPSHDMATKMEAALKEAKEQQDAGDKRALKLSTVKYLVLVNDARSQRMKDLAKQIFVTGDWSKVWRLAGSHIAATKKEVYDMNTLREGRPGLEQCGACKEREANRFTAADTLGTRSEPQCSDPKNCWDPVTSIGKYRLSKAWYDVLLTIRNNEALKVEFDKEDPAEGRKDLDESAVKGGMLAVIRKVDEYKVALAAESEQKETP
ncbi:hypothetical protein C8R46DRAFT_1228985 [Mycena filopes]|nr:hypothetical protein C8R46DRAFT_1228985 [Mycena filopes]